MTKEEEKRRNKSWSKLIMSGKIRDCEKEPEHRPRRAVSRFPLTSRSVDAAGLVVFFHIWISGRADSSASHHLLKA